MSRDQTCERSPGFRSMDKERCARTGALVDVRFKEEVRVVPVSQ
jgi:hypothetical protein